MKRTLICLLAALLLCPLAARALPADEPLVFGAYGDAAGAEKMPAADFDASMPRPGEAPPAKADTIPVSMSAQFIFPCPDAPARANLQNPEGSGKSLRYRVEIAVAELLRAADTDGGAAAGEEQIALCQTGLLRPGYALENLRLLPLPDGSKLPSGVYQVTVVVQGFDEVTNEIATADVQLNTELRVLVDEREMALDAMGEGRFSVYNGLDEQARYALVMSQQEAFAATGDPGVVDCEQPEYAYLTLYEEDIPAYGRADASVRVTIRDGALPAGEYRAYLVRYREYDPQAPEVVGRVTLRQY